MVTGIHDIAILREMQIIIRKKYQKRNAYKQNTYNIQGDSKYGCYSEREGVVHMERVAADMF